MLSRQAINSNTDATHKSIQIFTSGALPADAARELNVLGKYGHPFAMDGDKVSILKEASKIPLRGLLQRLDGSRLEPEIAPEILSDLADEALKRKPVAPCQHHDEHSQKKSHAGKRTQFTC